MAAKRLTTEPDTLPDGVSGSAHSAPRFTRICNNTTPHEPHNYWKRWHLRLLPGLIEKAALMGWPPYPEVWDSPYRCPGVVRR